jgi:hypothetical protein
MNHFQMCGTAYLEVWVPQVGYTKGSGLQEMLNLPIAVESFQQANLRRDPAIPD